MIARGEVRVAKRRGRIVGFVILDGAGEVQGLYVLPEAQGTGVAQALLVWSKAQQSRIGLWVHAANARARRFYQSQGFRPVALGDGNDERMTEIRYEWERAA
nr:GNAT family N-acetyltransferase [Maritimibacter dapengensis]